MAWNESCFAYLNSFFGVAMQPGNSPVLERGEVKAAKSSMRGSMISPGRLLVLEDDPNDAELLVRRLTREWPGCELVRTSAEPEFKEALAAGGFDLIISDYLLPGFHGLDALALARDRCPHVPFIFLSGVMGDDVAVESLKSGATDYVLKDRPARLVPAIRRALKEAHAAAVRKQIEEQLRYSAQALKDSLLRYENLVNSVDGIVWQADLPSLRVTFVSEQSERILGYPADRWIDEPNFWREHIHPGDRERALGLLKELTEEHKYQSFEYRMIAADGRIVWFSDIVSVRCESGKTPQIQGVMVDVTARKQAEERVARIQGKLKEANKNLVRRNREIQNFYHTLSHELKTPLTSAREFISIVLDGLAGTLTQNQADYLGIAKDSCNQLRVCINDLLDATRLETGKMNLDLKPSSLAALLQKAILTIQRTAGEKDLSIFQDIQPNLPDIPMDEFRMTQVVTNLLNNAIKFTPPGGQILVRAGEALSDPDYLQVSITDSGRGIPLAEQEHIFDRLYQVKAGDATTEQGVGLGLYLCRELVQLHGGSIAVESALQKGSTFSFRLPKTMNFCASNALPPESDTTFRLRNDFGLQTAPVN
jgi:PAS domain S-box-containing protein